MKIDVELQNKLVGILTGLRNDRLPFWNMWRDIAEFYIPKRYTWLMSDKERKQYLQTNSSILDSTGTTAGKVLAAGMMNGITSPSRPWFKLRLRDFGDSLDYAARRWLDEVERRMLVIMAESNFYNALAVMYLDLAFFATSAVLIEEDEKSIIRCYNCSVGEYYLGLSSSYKVDQVAREFSWTVRQIVQRWGIDNVSETIKNQHERGGANLSNSYEIAHLIMPNDGSVASNFEFVEYYWEKSNINKGEILGQSGYHELPGIFPRWEVTGNDAYGTGPGIDALGDVKQLQHETKRKAQGLDYMLRPPMVLDIQLAHKPTALLPGGQTFVAGVNNVGAKPAYQINMPINELTMDIRDIQQRIQIVFNNDLFKMISQLDTVRSATEIDARREEKLVQLGPVLERFQHEGLNPAVNRLFNIMQRRKLLPDAPASLHDKTLDIEYVSILSAAQSAVGVAPTERWLGLLGNVAAVYPGAADLPDWDELLRDYARDIGVKAKGVAMPDEVAQVRAARVKQLQTENSLQLAGQAAKSAKVLSETDVGGGANALQQIIGGAGG